MRGRDPSLSKAKWYIIGAGGLFLVFSAWFLLREPFYVFMVHRGRGEWASTRLAEMRSLDREFFEKHLRSEKWHVRISMLRTLRKMEDRDFAVPILMAHLPREKEASCRLEIAVALLEHGEFDRAKPVLEALVDDDQWGRTAADLLKKVPGEALDAAPPK
jgi:hypothetical protein